jgi:exodeoxyribonuclease III
MKIATWNVNSLTMRLPRVIDWLTSTRPDVLCVQETKVADHLFPHAELAALGYESATHGTGQWNGVAIISSIGLADVRRGFPGEPACGPCTCPTAGLSTAPTSPTSSPG